MNLHEYIRDVPDFPKKGIIFKDITPLLKDRAAFAHAIKALAEPYRGAKLDAVAAIESRGFILGAALALELGIGFIPIRKPGKLPYKSRRQQYALEYGTDAIEIHEDAVAAGQRILLVDDVIATGGTARAAADLLKGLGADLVGIAFLVELSFLGGVEKLRGERLFSVLNY
ncbi:MAG TPA: adenine phosphoribosyltransferase [Candidatus Ozemobacteraceae bacterium]|nr:adenine phosphoribosyltransferase [Candidatus Ozemobacteraceae bacterium]